MSLISISEVSHNFADRDIFKDISFSLEHNSRIGLVGPNGSGKTTLFNILGRKIVPHKGVVQQAKKLKIAYLSQEVELDENLTLYECVSSANEKINRTGLELEAARKAVATDSSETNLKKLEVLEEQYFQMGGYHYASEMKIILAGFNLELDMWDRKIADFSGGEKTRIQFARILLAEKDIMLLDEPTNHLDFTMIYWLENYLVKQDKPYLIISHDRHFLDKTVSKIAELRNMRIYLTHGNYSTWEADRANRELTQHREYQRQQKFIKETEDFIARNMAGQKVNQAKSRQKMLNRMEVISKPDHQKRINLSFKSSTRSGNDVFIFENAVLGYPGNALTDPLNLYVHYRNRIALVGENGSGKTTLLRCITGELEPLSGIAKIGASLNIGYYDQMRTELDEGLNVFDTLQALMPGAERGEVLSWLARFSFNGDEVLKSVQVLSGGEKARLYLAKLIWQQPNFLILDEPTNHLDINTIEELEKALQHYQGTVIFVSHDSYFIQRVANKIWLFKDKIIKEMNQEIEEVFTHEMFLSSRKKDTIDNRPAREKKINPQILERILAELEELQLKLAELDTKIEVLEETYGTKEVYNDKQRFLELKTEHDKLILDRKNLLVKIEEKEIEYLEKCE
ncbi:MAG: ABC-F family ATP-binding cassette domain-containing protein [Candidatus Stygibacter australis]|nr:ABC-F family ATP-binding cassette domain-containing protein [Candidatus Stygibacter australis]